MKRFALNTISVRNKTIPFFLREMGKYYWNKKRIILDYRVTPRMCVANRYYRMLKFFNPENMISAVIDYEDLSVFKYLVSRNINLKNIHFDTLLKREKILNFVLENKLPIAGIKQGLITSCECGYYNIVVMILKNYTEEFSGDNWYLRTALQTACYHGYIKIVQYLAENKLPLSSTLLSEGCNSIEIIKYFIEKGVKIEDNAWFRDLARKKCIQGNLEFVKFLFSQPGIQLNNHQYLSLAIYAGQVQIVDYLLDLKVDDGAINLPSDIEIIKIMLKKYNRNTLTFSRWDSADQKILDCFVEEKFFPDIYELSQLFDHNFETFKFLVEKGLDLKSYPDYLIERAWQQIGRKYGRKNVLEKLKYIFEKINYIPPHLNIESFPNFAADAEDFELLDFYIQNKGNLEYI